jgi:hypothetical protein
MKKSEAVKSFVSSSENGFNDYYEMQQSWTFLPMDFAVMDRLP